VLIPLLPLFSTMFVVCCTTFSPLRSDIFPLQSLG
jgi:hypothetical protein